MLDVSIKTSGESKLEKKLSELDHQLVSDKVLKIVGFDQLARIKQRTAAGKDYQNKPFKPYSPSYHFFRSQKGLPVSNVDLFFTGQMISAMDMELTGHDGIRLFFNDAQSAIKAHGHNFGDKSKHLPQRQFFEISKSDEAEIKATYEEEMQRMINEMFDNE